MAYRIDEVRFANFGVVGNFQCDRFGTINLVIGENGTGKTFLVKALYSAVRAWEEYRRGDDIRPFADVVSEKLRWTFQVDKLGELTTRSQEKGLSFSARLGDAEIGYQFTRSASGKVGTAFAPERAKKGNSVFIPAKEVLSLFSVILRSRDIDRFFGFDDTYYDLVKALRISPSRGRNYNVFAESRKSVGDVIDGKVEYDEENGKWFYKNRKNQKFAIGATSEGVKKIAIMDRLLSNGYLDVNSLIFIDEIESALHPKAICDFLDMLAAIAGDKKLQIFITSHSYFVIKKLYLLAMKEEGLVHCVSMGGNGQISVCDLHDGMPDNSIIDTSIRLYEQEIEEAF